LKPEALLVYLYVESGKVTQLELFSFPKEYLTKNRDSQGKQTTHVKQASGEVSFYG